MSAGGSPLRVGVLGCGYIARKAVAPALAGCRSARLEAIGSTSQAKALAFAREFGARPIVGYGRLVEDPGIDCVYIALPNAMHLPWIERAAAAGKHVICEKPAVLSPDEAERAVEACAKHGVRLLEAFMFRFHPQHALALEAVRDGTLGRVHDFEGAFGFPPLDSSSFRYSAELGGGALNDAGGYPIRAARLLFDAEPTTVYAHLVVPPGSEVDVRGWAVLEFPGERTARVTFGFDYAYRNTYTVWGSAGLLTLGRAFSIPPDVAPPLTLVINDQLRAVDPGPGDHFQVMIDAFAKIVREGADPERALEADLVRQALVVDAVRHSAREGRPERVAGA
jgi:NDP-hexose-3-ketoreductase